MVNSARSRLGKEIWSIHDCPSAKLRGCTWHSPLTQMRCKIKKIRLDYETWEKRTVQNEPDIQSNRTRWRRTLSQTRNRAKR
ncbi:hypothetical protein VTI74DRAFT_10835 [Chaetomium olivicolor]